MCDRSGICKRARAGVVETRDTQDSAFKGFFGPVEDERRVQTIKIGSDRLQAPSYGPRSVCPYLDQPLF